MAQTTIWRIAPEGHKHVITYTLERCKGRMIVTLDEDVFVLSAGFLSLKAARREPFRIVDGDGEAEQAVLVVDKKGKATLLFRAKEVEAER